MIRVNISIETDEDDLIGGNTLVDGNVVYREGSVLTAMKRGALLILDEIGPWIKQVDVSSGNSSLKVNPTSTKSIGEVMSTPAAWLQHVIATANTHAGSDDGKFMGAQVLDEHSRSDSRSRLNRNTPSAAQEKKIIVNKMDCREPCR